MELSDRFHIYLFSRAVLLKPVFGDPQIVHVSPPFPAPCQTVYSRDSLSRELEGSKTIDFLVGSWEGANMGSVWGSLRTTLRNTVQEGAEDFLLLMSRVCSMCNILFLVCIND